MREARRLIAPAMGYQYAALASDAAQTLEARSFRDADRLPNIISDDLTFDHRARNSAFSLEYRRIRPASGYYENGR